VPWSIPSSAVLPIASGLGVVVLPAAAGVGLTLLSAIWIGSGIWQFYAFFMALGIFGPAMLAVPYSTAISR
jgi:hypothetical protein